MTHPTKAEFEGMLENIFGIRLPGRPKQYPFEESAVQNYRIGSRMQLPDGTVWHYGEVTTALAAGMMVRGLSSDVVPETLAVVGIHAVGATVITITDTTAAHGADYWAGGKVEIWSVIPQHRRIIASTAVVGAATCTITLNRPLTSVTAVASGLEICRSPYASLVDSTATGAPAGLMSKYGIPNMPVTIDNFIWVQTWGMATLETANAGTLGIVTGSRTLFWYFEGTVLMEENASFVAGNQVAGFCLCDNVGPAEQTLAMLMIDP